MISVLRGVPVLTERGGNSAFVLTFMSPPAPVWGPLSPLLGQEEEGDRHGGLAPEAWAACDLASPAWTRPRSETLTLARLKSPRGLGMRLGRTLCHVETQRPPPTLGRRLSLAAGVSGLLRAVRRSQQPRGGPRAPVSQPEEATGARNTRRTRGQAHARRRAVSRTEQRRGAHGGLTGAWQDGPHPLTRPGLEGLCPTAPTPTRGPGDGHPPQHGLNYANTIVA